MTSTATSSSTKITMRMPMMAAVPRPDVGLVLALETKKRRTEGTAVSRRVGVSHGSNLATLRLQARDPYRKHSPSPAVLWYNQYVILKNERQST